MSALGSARRRRAPRLVDVRLFALTLSLAGAGLAFPRSAAAADANAACFTSYEQTQSLRKSGKLRDARQQALQCARDVCPTALSKDCARWAAEIDVSIPSVVFEAHGPDGAELVQVKVFMDDALLVERLDGKAVEVEPGAHVFRFEDAKGEGEPVTVQSVVREGEKNRKVAAAFGGGESEGSAPVVDSGGHAMKASRPVPVATYVFGGVGAAAIATGVVFAIYGTSQKSDLDACKPGCAPGDVNAMTRSFAVADVAFGVGIVSSAAAVYLYLTRPRVTSRAAGPRPSGLSFSAAPTRGGAAAAMQLQF